LTTIAEAAVAHAIATASRVGRIDENAQFYEDSKNRNKNSFVFINEDFEPNDDIGGMFETILFIITFLGFYLLLIIVKIYDNNNNSNNNSK
jgi:hypothetical protein